MIDLVVFDMIGTTIEASPRIPDAFREAYRAADIELSDADIDSVRGKSKREAIRELLKRNGKEAELSAPVYDAFQGYLLDCYRDGPVNAVPGAERTFDWCHDQKIDVALTTGFDRAVADLLISHLGWQDLVDTVVCNDEVERGRPAPDLIMTAMSPAESHRCCKNSECRGHRVRPRSGCECRDWHQYRRVVWRPLAGATRGAGAHSPDRQCGRPPGIPVRTA